MANSGCDCFDLPGRANILDEEHFGIVNGKLAAGIQYRHVGAISGLWAPPYVSSNFLLDVRAAGRRVPATDYLWRPFQVRFRGRIGDVSLAGSVTCVYGRRAAVLELAVRNRTGQAPAALEFMVTGWLDRAEVWGFARPESRTETVPRADAGRLVLPQGAQAVVVGFAGPGGCWQAFGNLGCAATAVRPGQDATVFLALAIGPQAEAARDVDDILADPAAAVAGAEEEYARRAGDLRAGLPRLVGADERLVRFYRRSLVHLLMNRWEVPEFILNPYYGTGSVKGGCVCNYLWNFGEIWEILPLCDPAAARDHIRAFLEADLFHHHSFNPMTGASQGSWYPVNQEKIIGLIYYYVLHTGDLDFLDEIVAGKTVLDHAVSHALFGDDPTGPAVLIDYGPANDHLELRRAFGYHHVMPDLNGRRYAGYLRAAALCDLIGRPKPILRRRAELLKELLKERLWDPAARWFCFADDLGRRELRWTGQVFKLLGSGVLDAEQTEGLLSHLNDREFLSDYGLHSMSKLDPAYDQLDIDNGGGGICPSFPAQIIEKLYAAGRPGAAEDILRRLLWWGELLPYWGDSLVANAKDYRRDTPLQCMVDGAAAAQAVIFGVFGVRVAPAGDVRIDPHPLSFAPRAALEGLRIRGRVLDIDMDADRFRVKTDGRERSSPIGQPIVLPAR